MANLRDELIQRTRSGLRNLNIPLQADAEKAIDRIVASGYKPSVVKREIKALTRGNFGRLRKELASAIEDAVGLVDRYNEYMRSWERESFIAPSRAAHGLAYGEAMAEAALAGQIADLTPKRFAPKTDADRFLARELKPWAQQRSLSTRLHSAQINAERETTRLCMRAIREGRSMQANNDLILGLARRGHRVGGAEALPQYLQEFERAGNALMRMQKPSPRNKAALAEYERALKTWRSQRRKVRTYASRLNEGGRVQGALVEVLQRTKGDNVKRMRGALNTFLGQKQSYHAERILDTETHSAYRSAQVRSDLDV